METIEELKRRASDAAKYIDPVQCAISPQCGFASTMGGNPVTETDERAKLRLCVEAAKQIWA
jgi:5-methyltetrahydropteroyltriglutamate--homocysteine methyltransferase